jgi:hypothetical protein
MFKYLILKILKDIIALAKLILATTKSCGIQLFEGAASHFDFGRRTGHVNHSEESYIAV